MYTVLLWVVEITPGPLSIRRRTGKLLDGRNFEELDRWHFRSFWQLMVYVSIDYLLPTTLTCIFNRSAKPSICHTKTQKNSIESSTPSYLDSHNSHVGRLCRAAKS